MKRRRRREGNGKSWRVLPSSGWSFLNHSTVGTGFPSPLSQYKEIDEPSFIGPKVAPVLNVFFVFSSMTRTNAGCTETETKTRSITPVKEPSSIRPRYYCFYSARVHRAPLMQQSFRLSFVSESKPSDSILIAEYELVDQRRQPI